MWVNDCALLGPRWISDAAEIYDGYAADRLTAWSLPVAAAPGQHYWCKIRY